MSRARRGARRRGGGAPGPERRGVRDGRHRDRPYDVPAPRAGHRPVRTTGRPSRRTGPSCTGGRGRDQISAEPSSDSVELVGVQRGRRAVRAGAAGLTVGQHQGDGVRPVAGTQLAQDGLDVGLDGVLADEQVAADLPVRLALEELVEHVGLAPGQGHLRREGLGHRHVRGLHPADLRVDDGPAGASRQDRPAEQRRRSVDHEVATDTGGDRLVHHGRVLGGGQRDDRDAGEATPQVAAGVERRGAARAELDDDGVGAGRLDQREGAAQFAGRTHRLHPGRLVDHADQTATQDGRVSEEEHAGDPAGGARHGCRHN